MGNSGNGKNGTRISNIGKVCKLEGCDKPAKKKLLCETHYQRMRINGSENSLKNTPPGTLLQWIKENSSYEGEECLIWPFSRSTDGRGQIYINGKNKKANRVMCEIAHGAPVVDDMQAAHS